MKKVSVNAACTLHSTTTAPKGESVCIRTTSRMQWTSQHTHRLRLQLGPLCAVCQGLADGLTGLAHVREPILLLQNPSRVSHM